MDAGGPTTGAAAGDNHGRPAVPAGFDPKPPGGFPGGYTRGEWDPLPSGYGWLSPETPAPAGWSVDPETSQLLPPGAEPAGEPPTNLLPGYTWVAPTTTLPDGWHIDPQTDVLIPPADLPERAAAGTDATADPDARQAWAFERDDESDDAS